MRLLPRSLPARLSSFTFLVLCVFAIALAAILNGLWLDGIRKQDQLSHWELAQDLAHELRPYLEGQSDDSALMAEMLRIIRINRFVDLGLLDRDGKLLYFANSHGPKVWNSRDRTDLHVDTAPIREFLQLTPNRRIPVFGEPMGFGPNETPEKRLFSADEVNIFGEPGYVYVTFDANRGLLFRQSLGTAFGFRATLLILGLFLLVAAALSSVLYYRLTTRFRKMTGDVLRVARGEHSVRLPTAGDDEISELGRNVNSMVDTIVEGMRKAFEANEYRRNMVAALSHDISSPLSALRSHGELLKGTDRSSEQFDRSIAAVDRNASAASNMIRDLLELTKLEIGQAQPEFTTFDVAELITEEIIPQLSPLAKKAGISLRADVEASGSAVRADIRMIARVLTNLVENAVRYSSANGEVVIEAHRSRNEVTVAVTNPGPGLTPEEADNLFEQYYRGDAAKKTAWSGSGLGLWIVRSLLEAHGKKIRVRSTPGTATSFSFELQAAE